MELDPLEFEALASLRVEAAEQGRLESSTQSAGARRAERELQNVLLRTRVGREAKQSAQKLRRSQISEPILQPPVPETKPKTPPMATKRKLTLQRSQWARRRALSPIRTSTSASVPTLPAAEGESKGGERRRWGLSVSHRGFGEVADGFLEEDFGRMCDRLERVVKESQEAVDRMGEVEGSRLPVNLERLTSPARVKEDRLGSQFAGQVSGEMGGVFEHLEEALERGKSVARSAHAEEDVDVSHQSPTRDAVRSLLGVGERRLAALGGFGRGGLSEKDTLRGGEDILRGGEDWGEGMFERGCRLLGLGSAMEIASEREWERLVKVLGRRGGGVEKVLRAMTYTRREAEEVRRQGMASLAEGLGWSQTMRDIEKEVGTAARRNAKETAQKALAAIKPKMEGLVREWTEALGEARREKKEAEKRLQVSESALQALGEAVGAGEGGKDRGEIWKELQEERRKVEAEQSVSADLKRQIESLRTQLEEAQTTIRQRDEETRQAHLDKHRWRTIAETEMRFGECVDMLAEDFDVGDSVVVTAERERRRRQKRVEAAARSARAEHRRRAADNDTKRKLAREEAKRTVSQVFTAVRKMTGPALEDFSYFEGGGAPPPKSMENFEGENAPPPKSIQDFEGVAGPPPKSIHGRVGLPVGGRFLALAVDRPLRVCCARFRSLLRYRDGGGEVTRSLDWVRWCARSIFLSGRAWRRAGRSLAGGSPSAPHCRWPELVWCWFAPGGLGGSVAVGAGAGGGRQREVLEQADCDRWDFYLGLKEWAAHAVEGKLWLAFLDETWGQTGTRRAEMILEALLGGQIDGQNKAFCSRTDMPPSFEARSSDVSAFRSSLHAEERNRTAASTSSKPMKATPSFIAAAERAQRDPEIVSIDKWLAQQTLSVPSSVPSSSSSSHTPSPDLWVGRRRTERVVHSVLRTVSDAQVGRVLAKIEDISRPAAGRLSSVHTAHGDTSSSQNLDGLGGHEPLLAQAEASHAALASPVQPLKPSQRESHCVNPFTVVLLLVGVLERNDAQRDQTIARFFAKPQDFEQGPDFKVEGQKVEEREDFVAGDQKVEEKDGFVAGDQKVEKKEGFVAGDQKIEQETTTQKIEQDTTTQKIEQDTTTQKIEQDTTTQKSEEEELEEFLPGLPRIPVLQVGRRMRESDLEGGVLGVAGESIWWREGLPPSLRPAHELLRFDVEAESASRWARATRVGRKRKGMLRSLVFGDGGGWREEEFADESEVFGAYSGRRAAQWSRWSHKLRVLGELAACAVADQRPEDGLLQEFGEEVGGEGGILLEGVEEVEKEAGRWEWEKRVGNMLLTAVDVEGWMRCVSAVARHTSTLEAVTVYMDAFVEGNGRVHLGAALRALDASGVLASADELDLDQLLADADGVGVEANAVDLDAAWRIREAENVAAIWPGRMQTSPPLPPMLRVVWRRGLDLCRSEAPVALRVGGVRNAVWAVLAASMAGFPERVASSLRPLDSWIAALRAMNPTSVTSPLQAARITAAAMRLQSLYRKAFASALPFPLRHSIGASGRPTLHLAPWAHVPSSTIAQKHVSSHTLHRALRTARGLTDSSTTTTTKKSSPLEDIHDTPSASHLQTILWDAPGTPPLSDLHNSILSEILHASPSTSHATPVHLLAAKLCDLCLDPSVAALAARLLFFSDSSPSDSALFTLVSSPLQLPAHLYRHSPSSLLTSFAHHLNIRTPPPSPPSSSHPQHILEAILSLAQSLETTSSSASSTLHWKHLASKLSPHSIPPSLSPFATAAIIDVASSIPPEPIDHSDRSTLDWRQPLLSRLWSLALQPKLKADLALTAEAAHAAKGNASSKIRNAHKKWDLLRLAVDDAASLPSTDNIQNAIQAWKTFHTTHAPKLLLLFEE